MVQCLIEVGKVSVDQKAKNGETATYIATQQNYLELLIWLVQEGEANVNLAHVKGATPLLASLRAEVVNLAVPRFLLSMGARVLSLDDPVLNGTVKAWIQEEVQKLEVPHSSFLYPSFFLVPLSFLYPSLHLQRIRRLFGV